MHSSQPKLVPFRLVSMALTATTDSSVSLFGAVSKGDYPTILSKGVINLRYGHKCAYWGLRTSPADALERARVFEQDVTKESHIVFEAVFTRRGYIQYTLTPVPAKTYPLLYCNDTHWGAWHLQGNIPLVDRDATTQAPLLEVSWHEII